MNWYPPQLILVDRWPLLPVGSMLLVSRLISMVYIASWHDIDDINGADIQCSHIFEEWWENRGEDPCCKLYPYTPDQFNGLTNNHRRQLAISVSWVEMNSSMSLVVQYKFWHRMFDLRSQLGRHWPSQASSSRTRKMISLLEAAIRSKPSSLGTLLWSGHCDHWLWSRYVTQAWKDPNNTELKDWKRHVVGSGHCLPLEERRSLFDVTSV